MPGQNARLDPALEQMLRDRWGPVFENAERSLKMPEIKQDLDELKKVLAEAGMTSDAA